MAVFIVEICILITEKSLACIVLTDKMACIIINNTHLGS